MLALAVAASVLIAACGSSSNSGDNTSAQSSTSSTAGSATTASSGGKEGGEFIDGGTSVPSAPEHIDPARNSTLDAYQIINALYDGLTDIDISDPKNPKVVPLVASQVTPNADASVWTFKIRDNEFFSNGEPVLPSSFARAWNRAGKIAGDYSYLLNFIKGGKEMLDKKADTLSGVVADDATKTLTVTLSNPYANFDAVAGFQLFFPMPSEVDKLDDKQQLEYENGVMIGNGPFKLAKARTDEEIVLVKNDKWAGDVNGNKTVHLDKITFKTQADPDTSYNALEAGEVMTANLPSGRVKEAQASWGTTLNVSILGSYHWVFNMKDPVIGGDKNVKLRQAIDQAINRDQINTAVYNGTRSTSTGVAPEGLPGFKAGLCKFCAYNKDAAQQAFNDWKAAGNSLSAPIPLQFNAGAGHEPVVAIMVENLKAIGIDAVATPMDSKTYFSQLAKGACKMLCRAGWYADYPTYDNFMYDLFASESIGGNNLGPYSNPKFDQLVGDAKKTTDKAKAGDLYNQAEQVLLNDDIGVLPINWYKGDYVYDNKKIAKFPQNSLGLVLWEQVQLAK